MSSRRIAFVTARVVCHVSRVLAVAALSLLPLLAGCNVLPQSPGGQVRLESIGPTDHSLASAFTHGLYRREDQSSATMVLFAGPSEQPRSAMVVRLFWVPRAGATPLDPAATNATLQYVVFGDDEGEPLALYSGAGFVLPGHRLGRDPMDVRILDTSVRLRDASEGYADPIGAGRLTGEFTVARDHAGTDAAIDRLNQLIRDRLGHPRLVTAD